MRDGMPSAAKKSIMHTPARGHRSTCGHYLTSEWLIWIGFGGSSWRCLTHAMLCLLLRVRRRRLNVAITRGKLAVWVVGSMETIKTSRDRHWGALLASADSRGLIASPAQDPELRRRLMLASGADDKISDKFKHLSSLASGVWQVGW